MNSIFILLTLLYCIFSIMLYFGSKPHQPRLRLPWLISHMLVIILTTIIFICWTFITFFIDLLITIVCPVISGLVLGLSILLWRLIYTIHTNYRDGDDLEIRSRIKTRWSESDRDSGKLSEMSWQREGPCLSLSLVASWCQIAGDCLFNRTGRWEHNINHKTTSVIKSNRVIQSKYQKWWSVNDFAMNKNKVNQSWASLIKAFK